MWRGKGKNKLGDNMKKCYLSTFSPIKLEPLSILKIIYIFRNICNQKKKISIQERYVIKDRYVL